MTEIVDLSEFRHARNERRRQRLLSLIERAMETLRDTDPARPALEAARASIENNADGIEP